MTCRAIAEEQFGKQARNKYATNNGVDPSISEARNTHATITPVLQVMFLRKM
jgi:hypothetical protein